MSSMSKSSGVEFTWQVLLVPGMVVVSQLTFSPVKEHFPRQSNVCEQRG
jgi:hypothetical protein